KSFVRRVEYLGGAIGFTTSDKHYAVTQDGSGVTRARRSHHRSDHSKTSIRVCWIKNFRGRQRPGVVSTTGNKHTAIRQDCRGVIDARRVERCAGGGDLRFRIEDFGKGDKV